MKPKALYFFQYLPPWRIDVFNEMAKHYDLTVAFTNFENEGFIYNREELLGRLRNVKTIFMGTGFKIGTRSVRFGIFRLIRETAPDVVFAHEYSPTSILAALFHRFKLFHYRYFITTSDNLQMAESASGLRARSRRFVLKRSDGIIVYSQSVKEWYKAAFPSLQVEICPNIQNPASLLSFRPSFPPIISKYRHQFGLEGRNVILYIGRLVDVKGLDLLLNAFAKLKAEDYKLVIVGEGKRKEALKEQAGLLGCSGNVVFAGFYSGPELYAWYDAANYFVLPSRYEPFGAVVNEALVYGCPVVASRYIGATDFVDESNGMLFDPLNDEEFVRVLTVACRKYRVKGGDRPDLMNCSFERYVSAFRNIYQS